MPCFRNGGYSATFSSNLQAASIAEGPELTDSRQPRARSLLRPGWLLAGTFVLLASVFWLYQWRTHRIRAALYTPRSIAVLPFLNLTGDPGLDYLGDGFTDQLTSTLGRVPGLRVVARTSAWQFRGKALDVRSIGSQLNVSSVLEGSIQSIGRTLRVTVQLISTSDGYHIWSEIYDRDRQQFSSLESDISNAVAMSLAAAVNRPPDRVDPQAYELYLRGLYTGQRASSLEDTKKEINFLNQAIDRDPLYANSYAVLAGAYVQQGANSWVAPGEAFPAAKAAAHHALELDPTQPWAHAVLAEITFWYDWDLPRAERELKRAFELNPSAAAVHQNYGILLTDLRRFDEAREQFKQAKELNPLWVLPTDMSTIMLYEAERNYDAAIEVCRRAMSEHDHAFAHQLLGFLYADKKQYEEAIQQAKRAVELAGDDPDTRLALAIVYAQSGQIGKARAVVKQVKNNRTLFVPSYSLAAAYAVLVEPEQMYRWLEKAVAERSPDCLRLNVSEHFDAYRSEPRFQRLLRTVGFAQKHDS